MTVPVDLSIIIVNWNSREFVDNCLLSLNSLKGVPSVEIIVVDNASYDGTQDLLLEKHPEVKYVQSSINGGFSYANNLGAKSAKGRILLFLNPDTEILDDAVVGVLDVFGDDETVGAAGCLLLNSDGSVQDSCVQAHPTIFNQIMDSRVLRRALPESPLWGNAILFSKKNGVHDVATLSGAFLMVRKKVFDKIGGFDDTYFMYAEDRDLCLRVAKAGYRVVIDKGARVIHYGGGSTSSDGASGFTNIMMRNATYQYFMKHRGSVYAMVYRISMSGNALVRLCLLFLASPVIRLRTGRFPAGPLSKWGHILKWSLGCARSGKPVSS